MSPQISGREPPGANRLLGPLRAVLVLTGFLALTVPLMPVQWLLLRVSQRAARGFPHWYHRRVCQLLGIRLHIAGKIDRNTPVLVVSNHVSWLDIPVLSAVAPVSFVAKREVGGWPFVSSLARLQRTIFVDRNKRSDVPKVTAELQRRLATGDAVVLFAEGTSSDGNRVLPFKSSLLAIAGGSSADTSTRPSVQTLSLVYTHVHGVPLGRADRHLIGWYGDMEMGSHAWELLKAGPIDVSITISPPMDAGQFRDRKHLTRHTEQLVRENVVSALRANGRKPSVATGAPAPSVPPKGQPAEQET
ncbi:MAG TPA: 1-acyl-sn-glycerol-3-phosphate acyltransferase [Hyphomicrobiaceae bacterium]|nr:1-acyl-sn-glycerol-3-phosphate acyltransferase [Hyphomicrobiaceae bacterium]